MSGFNVSPTSTQSIGDNALTSRNTLDDWMDHEHERSEKKAIKKLEAVKKIHAGHMKNKGKETVSSKTREMQLLKSGLSTFKSAERREGR